MLYLEVEKRLNAHMAFSFSACLLTIYFLKPLNAALCHNLRCLMLGHFSSRGITEKLPDSLNALMHSNVEHRDTGGSTRHHPGKLFGPFQFRPSTETTRRLQAEQGFSDSTKQENCSFDS